MTIPCLLQELHAVLFPPDMPPPAVKECSSHPVEWRSHPLGCSSHPLVDILHGSGYCSHMDTDYVSSFEVQNGGQQCSASSMWWLHESYYVELFAIMLP